MTTPSVASQRLQKKKSEMEGLFLAVCMHNSLQISLFISRSVAIYKVFGALTLSPAMRGGREVVGISVRRDEVKPAFKQQQQQQLAAPRIARTADPSPFYLTGYSCLRCSGCQNSY